MRVFIFRLALAGLLVSALLASQASAVPITVTFQQGVNIIKDGLDTGVPYTGAVDTWIGASYGTGDPTPHNTDLTMAVKEYAVYPQYYRALIAFTDIFGSGSTQIPAASTITGASLTITKGTAAKGNNNIATTGLYRMIMSWAPTVTWVTGFGGDGLDMNGIEAASVATTTFPGFKRDYTYETATRDVTADLAAWVASPTGNYGWALRTALQPSTNYSSYLNTSDATTATWRPSLVVTFEPPVSKVIPEPAGLGLIGVALLALRKRRS